MVDWLCAGAWRHRCVPVGAMEIDFSNWENGGSGLFLGIGDTVLYARPRSFYRCVLRYVRTGLSADTPSSNDCKGKNGSRDVPLWKRRNGTGIGIESAGRNDQPRRRSGRLCSSLASGSRYVSRCKKPRIDEG